jgi:hypothetical protein
MFLTTHAAAGIFLSQQFDNPYAVFGVSFASHFLLDFIPHGDERLYGNYELPGHHRYRRAVIVNLFDVIALITLTVWAIGQEGLPHSNFLMIGILGSLLPDFLNHFFPVIHQRLSWLWLARWIYAATKPTGLRYLVRAQDWLHRVLHHDIIRRDISFRSGLIIQTLLTFLLLGLVV